MASTDKRPRPLFFRLWHKGDVTWARRGVRFQGQSGHDADWLSLPSLTQSGHSATFEPLPGRNAGQSAFAWAAFISNTLGRSNRWVQVINAC
jgi:hypothetical protein